MKLPEGSCNNANKNTAIIVEEIVMEKFQDKIVQLRSKSGSLSPELKRAGLMTSASIKYETKYTTSVSKKAVQFEVVDGKTQHESQNFETLTNGHSSGSSSSTNGGTTNGTFSETKFIEKKILVKENDKEIVNQTETDLTTTETRLTNGDSELPTQKKEISETKTSEKSPILEKLQANSIVVEPEIIQRKVTNLCSTATFNVENGQIKASSLSTDKNPSSLNENGASSQPNKSTTESSEDSVPLPSDRYSNRLIVGLILLTLEILFLLTFIILFMSQKEKQLILPGSVSLAMVLILTFFPNKRTRSLERRLIDLIRDDLMDYLFLIKFLKFKILNQILWTILNLRATVKFIDYPNDVSARYNYKTARQLHREYALATGLNLILRSCLQIAILSYSYQLCNNLRVVNLANFVLSALVISTLSAIIRTIYWINLRKRTKLQ